MKKIGITGKPGFIGSHLANYLGAFPKAYEVLPFSDDFFEDKKTLENFVMSADVIVHLAGVNRADNQDFIYERNIELADLLIQALTATGKKPQIIFSSSSQESRDNVYGRGKLEARHRLAGWAERHEAPFVGLIIPNVFGPFGRPFYNSVVATFCHQLTHGDFPEIKIDTELELIYVADLINYIREVIDAGTSSTALQVPGTGMMKVSAILSLLKGYMDGYLKDRIIPGWNNSLEIALFNTLRSYRDIQDNAAALQLHKDDRGHLVEIVKEYHGGQTFFSSTKPGVTRGNHFHTRKVERFCVVEGEGLIRLRKIGSREIFEFPVSGKSPCALDIPVYHTHNITNTGSGNMLTLFWTNEIYDPENTDTHYEQV